MGSSARLDSGQKRLHVIDDIVHWPVDLIKVMRRCAMHRRPAKTTHPSNRSTDDAKAIAFPVHGSLCLLDSGRYIDRHRTTLFGRHQALGTQETSQAFRNRRKKERRANDFSGDDFGSKDLIDGRMSRIDDTFG